MGSCFGSHSDLADCTTYPASQRPGLQISSRTAAIPPEEKEHFFVYSTLHETIFQGTLLESDGKPRPRNPWAAFGSLAFMSVLLLALITITLLHADPLPKRETLTMLYLQPASAAGGNATKSQAPRPASTYSSTNTTIPTPVHKTQEAPPSPVGTTGMLGGVPSGVVGGVPGGVLNEMLNGAPGVPVLAKSPAPTPVKRMRIASRVAEANLIHDVPGAD